MPPTQITAATMCKARPRIIVISLVARRPDLAAIFGRRLDQPFPHRLGIGAGDVEIEARRIVDGVEERADMAEQALRAGADGKRPSVKIDGAALGKKLAAARPGDAQRRPAIAEIDDRGRGSGEGGAEQRVEVALLALGLDGEPALGTAPEERRRARPGGQTRGNARRDD